MNKRSQIEKLFQSTDDNVCSEGAGGMVAAAHPAATQAGVSMLEKGGNAADAAVATALALCVCEPQACSLGGQSYGLLNMCGRSIFLDGSGRIPQHLNASTLTRSDVLYGYKGTSVPTTPVVLACMQKRFGRLTWEEVIEPAIELAEDGYEITQLQHDLQKRELEFFLSIPGRSGSRYFLKDGAEPFDVGDTFVQPDLARLLKRLAENGVEEFYIGKTGRRIAEDIAGNGGFLSREDLAVIPWPHQRPAIEQQVFGCKMLTTPPPTQGRLLAYILLVAENMATRGIDILSEEALDFFADLFYSAYRIRMEQTPHPDLYNYLNDDILSQESIDKTVEQILNSLVQDVNHPGLEGGETTHLSVMDGEGNCVGITQSVNMVYGSKAAADGLGFMYNNYLIDSFALPNYHPHALIPGRTAPCSVAPFIMMANDGTPWLTGGSPGSQRIVTALSLFLIRVLHAGMPMDQAMRLPRFHCQEYKKVLVELDRFPQEYSKLLEQRGYLVDHYPPFYFGAVHATLRMQDTSKYQGVAEIRRDGSASGVRLSN
ncbi:gamma-glutamyltransferase [Desulfosediminicola ganghwensis]|uniref:gamma-glutamyltransferase n=1 Tax=Desulfosediminicola ganghwensis TaxID=2569540 RepID=UPI0010ACB53A|nr:gamma-glutamyltransferase [Desulfosediminicola ganghwensis]